MSLTGFRSTPKKNHTSQLTLGGFESRLQSARNRNAPVKPGGSCQQPFIHGPEQATSSPLPPLPPLGKSDIVVFLHSNPASGPLVFHGQIRTVLKAEYQHLPDDQISAQHLNYNSLMEIVKLFASDRHVPAPSYLVHSITQGLAGARTTTVIHTTVASQQSFEKAVDSSYSFQVRYRRVHGPADISFTAGFSTDGSCGVQDAAIEVETWDCEPPEEAKI